MTTFTNRNDAGYGTNTGPGVSGGAMGGQGMGRHHQGGPGGGLGMGGGQGMTGQGMGGQGMGGQGMAGQGMGGQGMGGQGMGGQGMMSGQTHHANAQNDFASNAPGQFNNDPGYNNTSAGHHGLGNAAGVGPGTGGATAGGGFTGPTNDTPYGYPDNLGQRHAAGGQYDNNHTGMGTTGANNHTGMAGTGANNHTGMAGTGANNNNVAGQGTNTGTGASASEKEILGKVERIAGTAICSSSLKAKGLEKEREAQALRAQAAELGQAEGLEAEAAARRQRAVAHGADPHHLGGKGQQRQQL